MPGSGLTPTPLFRAYRVAASLLAPIAWWSVSRKLARQGVPVERRHERLGNASLPRPRRAVIWFHAASVGESLSVLTLIARLGVRLPGHDFLITSGTASSAELVARRLPARTVHQFAPLDATGPVRRFLRHWQPVAAVFVESELWPLMLVETRATGARLALLNARLSERSVAGWLRRPHSARFVLDQFDVILTQNRAGLDNLTAMGADPAHLREGINLKTTSAPLPVDESTLGQLRKSLDGRAIWVASSTHPGEESIVLDAHRRILAHAPRMCLVLVPRHAERGDEVAQLISAAGLTHARRSIGQPLDPDCQVYLADTLGETGTWYAAAPIVFLGGSLARLGGHNPFEPAQAGAAILTGPHVTNFEETFAPLLATGGARQIVDADTLASAVLDWQQDGATLAQARKAAGAFARAGDGELDGIVEALVGALELDDA